MFTSKVKKDKLDKSTAQLLDLETKKKRLEIDNEQIQLELDNTKLRQQMRIDQEAHKHKLQLESERAVFNREKEIWKTEKTELLSKNERDKGEFEERLTAINNLKTQEAITLVKLDAQQKIKQAELDKERDINALKSKHAEDLANFKATEVEKYYKNLAEALQDMTLNGDKNTKFVQEMALKLIDKAPGPSLDLGVDITTNTKQLEASTSES